jgi:4-hydroxybutyryl-CoA dehydratase/vinylacetyl-CoA-Delta-isomerase
VKGVNTVPVENRVKMYRLEGKLALENADAISDIHGSGSTEAHRVAIFRESDIERKKKAAKRFAGIDD